ncbi:MAG: Bro-N domain-containing protein [Ruminococcus sp.]|nr:Bro-N domain-containing protein [Ruminococcus sp.]
MNENEVRVWNYESSEVRTVQVNGEPWFVLADVCKVLEISNSRNISSRLEPDEKGVTLVDTLGGTQQMTIINESGLYTVILRSDKPQAKPFRKWVTSVVLPSIRKTGSYSVQQPNAFENLSPQLQVLIQMETRQKQIEARQAEQATALAGLEQKLQNTCEVIALDKTAWRKDSEHLINKIARATGEGYGGIRLVYEEIYRSIESRAGVSLNTRLTNKRNRMAGEGVCKSKRDKLTRIDIIAEDKKLIEIYVAIVKELAVKYGVCA